MHAPKPHWPNSSRAPSSPAPGNVPPPLVVAAHCPEMALTGHSLPYSLSHQRHHPRIPVPPLPLPPWSASRGLSALVWPPPPPPPPSAPGGSWTWVPAPAPLTREDIPIPFVSTLTKPLVRSPSQRPSKATERLRPFSLSFSGEDPPSKRRRLASVRGVIYPGRPSDTASPIVLQANTQRIPTHCQSAQNDEREPIVVVHKKASFNLFCWLSGVLATPVTGKLMSTPDTPSLIFRFHGSAGSLAELHVSLITSPSVRQKLDLKCTRPATVGPDSSGASGTAVICIPYLHITVGNGVTLAGPHLTRICAQLQVSYRLAGVTELIDIPCITLHVRAKSNARSDLRRDGYMPLKTELSDLSPDFDLNTGLVIKREEPMSTPPLMVPPVEYRQ